MMVIRSRASIIVGLVALLTAAGTLCGCGPTPPNATKSAEAVVIKDSAVVADAPKAISKEDALTISKIEASKDMFEWYGLQTSYKEAQGDSEDVEAALAAKEAELLKKKPAVPVTDALKLVAFNWKLLGSASTEGKEEKFQAQWLFHKSGSITFAKDEDVTLVLRGWLDAAHMHYFPEDKGGDPRYFELNWSIRPSINNWSVGEYYLVTRETYNPVPNVPYRIHTFFAQVKKDEEGNWKSQGTYGEHLDLGWHADLGE
jgi:hypothetical protein